MYKKGVSGSLQSQLASNVCAIFSDSLLADQLTPVPVSVFPGVSIIPSVGISLTGRGRPVSSIQSPVESLVGLSSSSRSSTSISSVASAVSEIQAKDSPMQRKTSTFPLYNRQGNNSNVSKPEPLKGDKAKQAYDSLEAALESTVKRNETVGHVPTTGPIFFQPLAKPRSENSEDRPKKRLQVGTLMRGSNLLEPFRDLNELGADKKFYDVSEVGECDILILFLF